VQQVNLGPLATLGLTPMAQYYGDYAAPPAFLIALGQHFAWTADADFARRHYEHAMRVLDWIDGDADLDGDGFLEHETRSPMGNRNQGWKDSGMALVDEHGRGVDNPVAPCEVQGYVYAGKQQYAMALALAMRKFGEAKRLLSDAASLKQRFNDAFWMPDEGFIAYALDPQKVQVRSITSNPAHCLATGIVDGRYARAVTERMLLPDMFSGWGVRTLSSDHPSFNPFSYHLGTVWPVEAATVAFGMKRYGFHDEANRVAQGMFEVAALFPHHRLPEVIGGYQRDDEHPHPEMYPQSQSPQAWSASAIPLLVQSMLGLRPFAPMRLLLIDPALPAWLPDVTLRNLHVGGARTDIRFHRERDGSTGWKVLDKQGTLTVLQQPPESSVTAGWPARAVAGGIGRPLAALSVPFIGRERTLSQRERLRLCNHARSKVRLWR
jgi:glycogen debranching enzyme